MSYLVLARKWRPKRFSELIGQGHVVRALQHALAHDRLHHAYLFTGTRGVGKTTLARLVAKALNCETGIHAEPCGVCGACCEIDQGRFVDLIEVDAASRTGVDDTRELLDNVQYAPARGRYKVYLIDEVHMFSKSSFNALLKTLEEPPPHVTFLFATTDAHKVPPTILSRCLRFNLKHLLPEEIAGHLAHVLAQEGIAYEETAPKLLARAAQGSVRDALSLLDQAIAHGGGRVHAAEVRAMLGTLDDDHVYVLIEALAAGDVAAVLERVDHIAVHGADFDAVLDGVLYLLQRVAMAQVLPLAVDDAVEAERVQRLTRALTPEDVQLYYQIALIGRRDLALAPDARGGFEMTLLRMHAFRPAAAPPAAGSIAPADQPPQPTSVAPPPAASTTPSASPPAVPDDWPALLAALPLRGAARELAANCRWVKRDGDAVHLALSIGHEQLRAKAPEQRLQEALASYFHGPIKLVIEMGAGSEGTPAAHMRHAQGQRMQAAEQAIADDPQVRALTELMGARIQSVQPIES